jgi:prepilin-type N-terminal cleavage/methylation domain-containing protein/prepilin-type processing-associated H-X9-DG protein
MNPYLYRAFTLVELLVVISIVAILAALAVPALHRSQAAAQRVRCFGHLRQLVTAATLYWDDHDGRTFRYRGPATNGGDLFWFGWLARGAEGARRFDVSTGALYPYLGGQGVEVCPALAYALREFKLKATGAAYGYGYNLHLSTKTGQTPVKISRIPDPAQIATFADAAQVNTFQPPASPEHPMIEEFYFVSAEETTVHFRHRAQAGVAFCDGHVAPHSPVPGSLDTRLPRHSIGRLPPARLSWAE